MSKQSPFPQFSSHSRNQRIKKRGIRSLTLPHADCGLSTWSTLNFTALPSSSISALPHTQLAHAFLLAAQLSAAASTANRRRAEVGGWGGGGKWQMDGHFLVGLIDVRGDLYDVYDDVRDEMVWSYFLERKEKWCMWSVYTWSVCNVYVYMWSVYICNMYVYVPFVINQCNVRWMEWMIWIKN